MGKHRITPEDCFQQFVDRDYGKCVVSANTLGEREGWSLSLIQFLLISLIRLDETETAGNAGRRILEIAGIPWHRELISLTLGRANPRKVIESAVNATAQCQALYYAGVREINNGNVQAGTILLKDALSLDVECLEGMLAVYELEHLSSGASEQPSEQALLHVLEEYARTSGRRSEKYAEACLVLGVVQAENGNAGEGLERIAEALVIFREINSLGHPRTIRCSQYLAGISQQVAEQALRQGDVTRAEDRLRTALQHLRPGGKTPELAALLNALARMLRERGELPEAEPLYREGLDVVSKVYGDQHPMMAATLSNLGMLYQRLPDIGRAIEHFEKALAILRGVEQVDAAELATVLHNLASAYRTNRDLDRAESHYLEAYGLIGSIDERHPVAGEILKGLSRLLFDRGRFSEAADVGQDLVIHDDNTGNSPDRVAEHRRNLGVLYRILGRYREAEPLLERSVEIYHSLGEEYRSACADALCELAMLRLREGDYAGADHGFRKTLQIVSSDGAASADRASAFNGLASLREMVEDYDAARNYYHQALDAIADEPGVKREQLRGSLLSNLALLEHKAGNLQRAEDLFKEAVALREREPGESSVSFATLLVNFGNLYELIGGLTAMDGDPGDPYYALAEPLYLRAWHTLKDAGETSNRTWFQTLRALGWLFYVRGDYDRATALYQEAAPKEGSAVGHSVADLKTQANLVMILAARGQTTDAMRLMLDSADRDDRVLRQVFALTSERQRLAFAERWRGELYALLSLLVQDPVLPDGAAHAFEMVLRRKGVVAEAGVLQRSLSLEGLSRDDRANVEEWKKLGLQLARLTMQSGDVDAPPPEILAALEERYDAVGVEVARLFPQVEFARRLSQAKIAEIVRALPEGGALIEFLRAPVLNFRAQPAWGERRWSADRYFAFVLRGSASAPLFLDLGEAEPIDTAIGHYRGLLTGVPEARALSANPTEPAASHKPAGRELRRALFDPLVPALGGCSRVILAPDGDLNQLAFEVLPRDSEGYLVDDYEFSYVSVARDLLRPAATGAAQAPLVLADPDFDLSSGAPDTFGQPEGRRSSEFALMFSPLPGTAAEGLAVASALGVEPVTRDRVLEKHLKQVRSPVVLHVATHGFFLRDQERSLPNHGSSSDRRENPMLRSGLALAGANWKACGFVPPADAEDGLLTAEDAAALDLAHTQLVVLSACDTGLGAIGSGEGVFGLRRAITLAGARTLVMSLWKVPDLQTVEFFAAYYRHLLKGKGRSESLHEARREVRRRWPHPLYWGAFICQGDWTAIAWPG